MSSTPLAAMIYEQGQGHEPDALLRQLADALRADGVALAGTTQRAAERPDRCRCDMLVTDLATGLEHSISEDRGPLAQGCHLDAAALERIAGATLAALDAGARMLIVNKFGKSEMDGRGFRTAIGHAVERGVPVLVAVNRNYAEGWRAFAQGLGTELPADPEALRAWCRAALATNPAATAAAPAQ